MKNSLFKIVALIFLSTSLIICDERSSIYAQEALPANSTVINFGSGSSSGGWSWSLNSSQSGTNDAAFGSIGHYVTVFTTGGPVSLTFDVTNKTNNFSGSLVVYQSTSNGNWGSAIASYDQNALSETTYSIGLDPTKPYIKIEREVDGSGRIELANISVNNFYVMPSSGSASITTCANSVTDPGGNGNYTNNINNSTLTIYPQTAGSKVRLTFNSFSTEFGYDDLEIYDGNSTAATKIGTYEGTTSPGTITSTASDGSLTLEFYSDFSNTSSGFDATISCHSNSAPSISSFTPTELCEGATVTITGTNFTGATAVSVGGTAVTSYTVNSATEISAVVGSGTTGTISVTNNAGSGTSSSSLTINSNPTLSASSSNSDICSGESVDLTATSSETLVYSLTTSGGLYTGEKWVNITTGVSGSGTVVWAQGNGEIGDNSGLLTNELIDLIAYKGQTLYLNAYDKYDDGWDGSIYELSLDGTLVINNSGATPDDGNNDDASAGWDQSSAELESSESFVVSSGSTFAWSSDVGGYSSSDQNPTGVSPSENTVYAVTETDLNGCSSTATTSVNVDPQPSISSHPSDGADVCIGETPTAMSVTATGGSGSYTYQWYSNTSNSNSGGTIIPVATSSSYTPGAGAAGLTYYYCVVSDAQSGCNDATSNAAQQRVNAATAGSITSSVDGGSTYSSDQKVIQVQNNMFWSYSSDGTNGTFSEFEYHWGDNNWSNSWNNTSNPGSWGAGQTYGADGVIYVRAKVLCGTDPAYTSAIATDWVWNYGGNGNAPTSAITASLSGSPSSISNGGDMRIDQTISWSKPSTSFQSSNYTWEYEWNNDGTWNSNWQTGTNPAVWSDNIGSNVSSGDAVLTVRTKHYGSGNDSYSAEYAVTLKKPVISTSGSLSAFSNCDGSASSAQSFNISGSYLGSDVTVTAPTGFELSESSGGTYTSSLTLSPTNGTLASTAIYVRVASSASGTPSGNIACTATAATTVNVAASATVVSAPVITTSSDLTDVTTCGLAELNVATDGSGGSGQWSYTGGSLAYTNGSSTDASVGVSVNPSDVNTDITMTWTTNSGETCAGSTVSKVLRFNRPSVTGSMDADSWVFGGTTNTEWTTGSNWYRWDNGQWIVQQVQYPQSGSKIYVLPTSDICVSNNLTNAWTSFGDLNIQGGTFDFGSANTSITGNITNNGAIQGGTGTVTLNGSSDQTISGSGTINFNNLTVNKDGSNVILSSTTNVESTLTMTKGNIVNSQPLVLGSSSASPGTLSHASGIVTGELRRYFANATGSTFFPVGTSTNMRDVTINFTQAPGTDEYLTVSYVAGAPTLAGAEGSYSGLPLTTNDNQLIQNYSEDGHWNIDPTGGLYESTEINSAAYEITLHCKALSVQPTDVSKVRIIKSAGSETPILNHVAWTGLDLLSSSGTGADFTVTAAATGFSKFGAGSEEGNPLPVELVSFSGACNDGFVELIWETASEYNSSHFDVENSRDGITWDVVKTIEAAGNSNEMLTYSFNDVNAHGGDNYYRLTQVDIDGTSKTYDVINVSCAQTTSGYFSIFPNPSSGSFQVMLNNSDIVGRAEMNIVDTKGNKVMMKSIDVKSGINMFVINESLAPGIYYISILNGNYSTIVLKHSVK